MKLPVLDMQGAHVGTLEVSDLLFNVPMNTSVVHQAMVRQRANGRQGTSNTKTRGNVSGGGIKPRPQKHSGRSRQGSIRSPQWRHGGIVFGPHPRSYRQRMPKKMRRLAIRCALSDKARENRLILLQALELSEAKAKEMKGVLEVLEVSSSALLVTGEPDQKVVLSARNLERVMTLPAAGLNVLDLLNHDRLIMTVDAVRKAEELWAGGHTSDDLVVEEQAKPRRRTPRKRATVEPQAQPAAVEAEGEAVAQPEADSSKRSKEA